MEKYEEIIIIKKKEDLTTLLQPAEKKRVVQIRIDSLDKSSEWEKMINRYYNDCGCKLGMVFTLASLGLFLAYFTINYFVLQNTSEPYLLEGTLTLISGLVIGKLAGILLAKFRLRRGINRLMNHL